MDVSDLIIKALGFQDLYQAGQSCKSKTESILTPSPEEAAQVFCVDFYEPRQ